MTGQSPVPERLVSILCLLLSVSVHVSLQNLVSQNTKYQSWLSMVAMISVMSNGWQGYFVFSTFQVQWESPRSPGQNGQVFLLRGLTLAVSSNFFTIANMMPSCHGNGGSVKRFMPGNRSTMSLFLGLFLCPSFKMHLLTDWEWVVWRIGTYSSQCISGSQWQIKLPAVSKEYW